MVYNKVNYSNGKIYKIICNKTGLVYIGSTCRTLEERLKEHINDSKRYLNKERNIFISSIFVTFNNDFNIELIENYSCDNRQQLENRENFHISNSECVNFSKRYKNLSNYKEKKDNLDNLIKMIIDKLGNNCINILFRYGIDEYKSNKIK
jgi:hypothetical protein